MVSPARRPDEINSNRRPVDAVSRMAAPCTTPTVTCARPVSDGDGDDEIE